ncbi:response regulator transcription factor [Labrys portucalensis]|uniref:Response regulator transcription factor n=1 Tax=Labrys neptuniae TaxID=376174 RepID=A0ABV6ZRP3_9HYPH
MTAATEFYLKPSMGGATALGRNKAMEENESNANWNQRERNIKTGSAIPEIAVLCRYNFLRSIFVKLLRNSNVSSVVRGYNSIDEFVVDCHDDDTVIMIDDSGSDGIFDLLERNIEIFGNAVLRPKFILISDIKSHAYIEKAFALGAKGFIDPSTSVDVALAAIGLVWAGGQFLPRRSLGCPLEGKAAGEKPLARSALSPREAEIVNHLQAGRRNKEISYLLNLKQSTVAVHIRNIIQKLNVKSRMDLIKSC